jgi:hypothetical protein
MHRIEASYNVGILAGTLHDALGRWIMSVALVVSHGFFNGEIEVVFSYIFEDLQNCLFPANDKHIINTNGQQDDISSLAWLE